MNCGLLAVEEQRPSPACCGSAPSGPSPSRSRKRSATRASKKSGFGARVQAEGRPQLAAGHGAGAERGEESEFDGREQDLGRPEGHADFHDSGRGQRFHGISSRLTSIKGTGRARQDIPGSVPTASDEGRLAAPWQA